MMENNRFRILYEDSDILVCVKPAGIASQTKKAGSRIWSACCVITCMKKERRRISAWCIVWISRWRGFLCSESIRKARRH